MRSKKSKIIPEDGSGVFITHATVHRRLEWHRNIFFVRPLLGCLLVRFFVF